MTIGAARFLIALIFSFCSLIALAGPDRGVWFWGSTSIPDGTGGTTSSAYGSDNVVGDSVLEADSLAFFKLHRVNRVYGSYGGRPGPSSHPDYEPVVIAAWNEKLHCLRIESQLLLEAVSVSDVDDIPNILSKVTNRLISFNNLYPGEPAKHFQALHLDIEPQQTPPYSVRFSAELDGIRNAPELMRLRSSSPQVQPLRAAIPIKGKRGFWTVEVVKD